VSVHLQPAGQPHEPLHRPALERADEGGARAWALRRAALPAYLGLGNRAFEKWRLVRARGHLLAVSERGKGRRGGGRGGEHAIQKLRDKDFGLGLKSMD